MKVVSTREIINALQQYENRNGIGIILGFSDKSVTEPEYSLKIANGNEYGLINDPRYQPKEIKLSTVDSSKLFI